MTNDTRIFITARLTTAEARDVVDALDIIQRDYNLPAPILENLRTAQGWLQRGVDDAALPVESRTNRYDDPRPVDVPDYGYRCRCDDCANIRY